MSSVFSNKKIFGEKKSSSDSLPRFFCPPPLVLSLSPCRSHSLHDPVTSSTKIKTSCRTRLLGLASWACGKQLTLAAQGLQRLGALAWHSARCGRDPAWTLLSQRAATPRGGQAGSLPFPCGVPGVLPVSVQARHRAGPACSFRDTLVVGSECAEWGSTAFPALSSLPGGCRRQHAPRGQGSQEVRGQG